jgi:hypothetical protein
MKPPAMVACANGSEPLKTLSEVIARLGMGEDTPLTSRLSLSVMSPLVAGNMKITI